MLLVLDNYDSFTWNLVQLLGTLGAEPRVVRNDEVSVESLLDSPPARMVISPGPCTPSEAGVSIGAIRALAPLGIPVLGVCLGHQALCEAFGGKTVRARTLMHGKVDAVEHTGEGIFQGLPTPLEVARYHSLVTDPSALPAELEVMAWSRIGAGDGAGDRASRGEGSESTGVQDREIQAVRHRTHLAWGVQFHPESLFSRGGDLLLRNFLALPSPDPTR